MLDQTKAKRQGRAPDLSPSSRDATRPALGEEALQRLGWSSIRGRAKVRPALDQGAEP